jgi:hypothetical protein
VAFSVPRSLAHLSPKKGPNSSPKQAPELPQPDALCKNLWTEYARIHGVFQRLLFGIFFIFAAPAFVCAMQSQQPASDAAGQASNGDAKAGSGKSADSKSADTSAASATAATCTVRPGTGSDTNDSKSQSAGSKAGDTPVAGGSSGQSVQVNQYAGAQSQAPKQSQGKGQSAPDNVATATLSLPDGDTNANQLAGQIKGISSYVVSANAINPSQIVVVLNTTRPKTGNPPVVADVLRQIQGFLDDAAEPDPNVFTVNLPAGKVRACDIAHALVNAVPEISEITAVDDARLLVTTLGDQGGPSAELVDLFGPHRAMNVHNALIGILLGRDELESGALSAALHGWTPAVANPQTIGAVDLVRKLHTTSPTLADEQQLVNALRLLDHGPLPNDLSSLFGWELAPTIHAHLQAIHRTQITEDDFAALRTTLRDWHPAPATQQAAELRELADGLASGHASGAERSRLVALLKDADESVEGRVQRFVTALAVPAVPTAPAVETRVQRLYYNHDPSTLAKIVTDAFPNVEAEPVLPDAIVLSDPADMDDGARKRALDVAARTIARIDQPHPQVSVDAWSLQLATDNRDRIHEVLPILEDLANAYNEAIDHALLPGWLYLNGRLSDVDPLLREYLTEQGAQNGAKGPIYGLGYETLYEPLTPHLIDMLVSLTSLQKPNEDAAEMLSRMGTEPALCEGKGSDDSCHKDIHSRPTCRERDEAAYEKEIADDENLRKLEQEEVDTQTKNGPRLTVTPPHPKLFHLSCVRETLMDGLLRKEDSLTTATTSRLGQFRAALADFLFHYKIMVFYPDDFHGYLEPMAADTLDSALNPIVSSFDEDLSAFQASLQQQIAEALAPRAVQYGYGGLVSLKVLSGDEGTVSSETQNYFDVTPPVTLNDLLSALQTEGASAKKTPLSSLVTSLAPAKAVELLTALGTAFTPKTTTAHLGRDLDLDVTAHALSGAYGAELDLQLQSTENGAGLIQAGGGKPTDDLNSRVSQHKVNTHVRLDSLKLFNVSTLGSVLARGQTPWKPFDPVEVPLLSLLVKVPKKPKMVYTQSLAFIDAVVVPTAADLGYGVPSLPDSRDGERIESYGELETYLKERLGNETNTADALLAYHNRIVACLNSEYVGSDGTIKHRVRVVEQGACAPSDYLRSPFSQQN